MTTIIPAPRINTNDDKVQIVRWHVAANDQVQAGAEIVDLETSKAVVTITAESDGFVRPLAEVRAVIKVGAPMYQLAASLDELAAAATPAAAAPAAAAGAAPAPVAAAAVAPGQRGTFPFTRFSKAALALIAARGWSPNDFQGAGLVTAQHLQAPPPAAVPAAAAAPAANLPPPIPMGPATANTVDVPLSKRAEIQSLTIGESGNVNSMLSVCFPSEAIRKKVKDEDAFFGSIQPIILFEIARLLKEYPQLTSYFHSDQIHYYDRVDLGLAVDMGEGLKVVTLPEADKMMPIDIFKKSVDIGRRYMRGKLKAEELVGSTFTVSDLSGLNMMYFHPLINGHQAAIIGIGGDTAMPGQPITLNMTFDHRISSGREVGTFLNELRRRILNFAAQPSDQKMVVPAAQGGTGA